MLCSGTTARTAFFDGADFFLSSPSPSFFEGSLLPLLPVERLFCPFFGLRGAGVTPSFLAGEVIIQVTIIVETLSLASFPRETLWRGARVLDR